MVSGLIFLTGGSDGASVDVCGRHGIRVLSRMGKGEDKVSENVGSDLPLVIQRLQSSYVEVDKTRELLRQIAEKLEALVGPGGAREERAELHQPPEPIYRQIDILDEAIECQGETVLAILEMAKRL